MTGARWTSPPAVAVTAAVVVVGGLLTVLGARDAGSSAAPAPATAGADLFRAKGCIGCHDGPDGADSGIDLGPPLTALADVAGERVDGLDATGYVRQSIQEPQAFIVPGYEPGQFAMMPALGLSEPEIDTLAAWLLR